jgi:iron complex transport system substrate-binding protein
VVKKLFMSGLLRTICFTFCCFALLCASCATKPVLNKPSQRVFTDELSRQIALDTEPQRIISLAPSLTETLFALGLGDRLVGVTSYCDFPAAAKNKEKIGDTIQPDLERIIALKPDLVVITTASQLEKLTQQLDQLAIPVYVANPRTVREVFTSIRKLGEATGATARATALADELEQRLDAVTARVASLPKPRVLFVLQTGPLITAGRAAFINDLLNLAGGESISGAETSAYPQFSRETVIARAPEIIIAPESHGAELVSEDELRRAFADTPAVRANRIVRLNPDLTSRPGPRLIEGLEQLARALHPEP